MDDLQKSEEAFLVLRAQDGDHEAFRALVDRYDRRLLYFIRRILDQDEQAFDVLQNVWMAIHRNFNTLKTPRAFRVWIYRIAHNQTISALRKFARDIPMDETPIEEIGESQSPDLNVETADLIHTGLSSLSIDHRRVLVLHFLEDMSIEEMSEVLDIPEGTVKSRIHHAKLRLQDWVERNRNE